MNFRKPSASNLTRASADIWHQIGRVETAVHPKFSEHSPREKMLGRIPETRGFYFLEYVQREGLFWWPSLVVRDSVDGGRDGFVQVDDETVFHSPAPHKNRLASPAAQEELARHLAELNELIRSGSVELVILSEEEFRIAQTWL